MPLQVTCPHCGETLWVPEEYAGRAGLCYACGGMVRAPDAEPEGAPLATHAAWDSAVEWTVILDVASFARLDPAEHGPPLSRALGMEPGEASRELRRGQGIVTAGKTRQQADAAIAALLSLGLTAAAAPTSIVTDPVPALHVRRLTWDDRDLVAPGEPEVRVPWDAVIAVNRGRAPMKQADKPEPRVSSGTIPAARMAVREGPSEAEPPQVGGQLVADLVSESPPVRLRVSSQTFDFSLLGDAASDNLHPNMRALLSHLVLRCRRAILNPPAPELRPAADASEVDPAGGRLFEARTAWLYNIARLGAGLFDASRLD